MPLYGPDGNLIVMPLRPPAGRAAALPLTRRSAAYLGEYDTPEKIKAAWTAAKGGELRAIMTVAEELENDPRFLGLIRKRRLAVSQLDWRVTAGGEDPRAQQIAAAAEQMLKRLKLHDIIEHLQDAVVKPLAAAEIVWRPTVTGTDVAALVPRLGTEFTFDYLTTEERLRLVTDPARPKGEPLEPLQFVVRYSQEKGRTLLARGGLVKGLAGRWLIRNLLWIAWLAAAERWGDPTVIGKYPQGIDDESIRRLEEAVQAIGRDAAGVIPDSMLVEVVQTAIGSGGQTIFEKAMLFLERDIAIGIGGETMTSQGSDLGRGSMAVAEVHNTVREELIRSDATDCAEVLTEQLLVPWTIFNYGEQAGYPQLEILTDPDEDMQARLTMDEQLVRIGIPLTRRYFYETYDRPEPGAGDLLVSAPAAPAFGPLGFGSGGHDRSCPYKRDERKGGGCLQCGAQAEDLPGQIATDRALAQALPESFRIYQRQRAHWQARLRAAESAADLDWSGDADFSRVWGTLLTDGSLAAAAAGHGEIKTERLKAERLKAGMRTRQVVSLQAVRAGQRAEDVPVLEADFLRLRSFTIARIDEQQILTALQQELETVLRGGGTFQDFRSRADALLAERLSDGHAETVYRTNLQTAYNAGKWYEGMAARDALPYWRYLTVGDAAVRPAHAAMHGLVFRKDDPIWTQWWPPNGFNCRCSAEEHDDFSLRQEGLTAETGAAPAAPDDGFGQNAAAAPRLLEQLATLYRVAEQTWQSLQLGELPAAPEPAAAVIVANTAADEAGRPRTVPATLLQRHRGREHWIAQTLADPQEIWGWPGRETVYLAVYETAAGVETVAVSVWGEVRDVQIVAGGAERFRTGMLLYKKS